MLGFQTQLRTITESTVDMGVQIFKLAINENWIQGRGMDKVVPVCLYTACRREPHCQVMLIDFADLVKVCDTIDIVVLLINKPCDDRF